MYLQPKRRKGIWQILMQNYFLLQDEKWLRVLPRMIVLLKVSFQCILDSLFNLRKQLCCIVAIKFLSLFLLLLNYLVVGGGVVSTYEYCEFRRKAELFLHQLTRSKLVPCTPVTRSLSQGLSMDCKKLWNLRLVRKNGRGCFQRKNRRHIYCAHLAVKQNPERGHKPNSSGLQMCKETSSTGLAF